MPKKKTPPKKAPSLSGPRKKSKRLSKRKPGRPAGGNSTERRLELLNVACRLATLRSVDNITLRAVAKASGVAPPLVRYYFGNREGLQRALVDHMIAVRLPILKELISADGPIEERLHRLIKGWLKGFQELDGLNQIVFTHVLYPSDKTFVEDYVRPMVNLIRPVIDQGVAEGKLRRVEYMFLHVAISGACLMFLASQPRTAAAYDYHVPFEQSLEAFGDYIADLFVEHLRIR